MDNALEYYESSRLQTFNDAIFAIVSTILILPLRYVEISKRENFVEYLSDVQNLVIVYFLAFLLICSVWESHIMRWIVVTHVDDVLVWLNMISLLFVSFLPFTVRLVSEYTDKEAPCVLSCGLLLVLEFIEMLIVFYTFSQKILLRGELRILLAFELKQKRNYVLKRKLLNIFLYVGAACLTYIDLKISWVLIAIVIITPCINRLFEVIIYRMNMAEERRVFLYENTINKERVESFTDGVYAIVATLLILDITSENFPNQVDGKSHGLLKALSKMWPMYMTYCGTFAVCTLLWFVQHSLFNSVKKCSYLMFIINNVSLSCVGSLPFIVSIVNNYMEDVHKSDRHAIQFCCLIVGLAGICQFTVFTLALYHQYVCHHVVPVGAGSSRHNYLGVKLLIIPLVAIVIYACSFASNNAMFITYHVFILATPLIFIFVKCIYLKIINGQVTAMNVIQDNPSLCWTFNPPADITEANSYDQYT